MVESIQLRIQNGGDTGFYIRVFQNRHSNLLPLDFNISTYTTSD